MSAPKYTPALISAAPDMAEVLRLMLKEWRSLGCADKGCLVCKAQDEAVAAGRAALKKAGVEL